MPCSWLGRFPSAFKLSYACPFRIILQRKSLLNSLPPDIDQGVSKKHLESVLTRAPRVENRQFNMAESNQAPTVQQLVQTPGLPQAPKEDNNFNKFESLVWHMADNKSECGNLEIRAILWLPDSLRRCSPAFLAKTYFRASFRGPPRWLRFPFWHSSKTTQNLIEATNEPQKHSHKHPPQ